jgi:predicted MFS family arabinose efflux permease
MTRTGWRVALTAGALTAIAMGGRQAFGVFVSPLNTATGLGLAAISLALALGQLGIGLAQPLVGRWADRAGPTRVIMLGAGVLAFSTVAPVLSLAAPVLFASLVLSAMAGSAVGSNGLLMGSVSRSVSPGDAGLAVGIVGAGASVGQLVLGPLLPWLIGAFDWQAALLALAALSLLAFPLARVLREAPRPPEGAGTGAAPVADALRNAAFWRPALSFAICGLHVAFLAAHMPGAIERCGFPSGVAGAWIALAGAANIVGSLGSGMLMKRLDHARWLASLYVVRAVGILAFLLVPPTLASLLAFAVVMGASHMATLPPTSSLIAQRFGTARLGTLFGMVMLVHQAGSFLGVWLGGWLADHTGGDSAFWAIDVLLALAAAALVWPWRGRLHAVAPAATAVAAKS